MKRLSSPVPAGFAAFAIALVALAAIPASAQTIKTWNATSGTWATPGSWSGGVAAGATDTASFSGSGAGTNAVTVLLDSGTSVGGMSFSSGTTVLRSSTNSARSLTLGTGGITLANTAGPVTIGVSGSQVNLVLDGTQTFTNNFTVASGKMFTVAGTVNTAGSVGSTLTVAGSGSTTISGVISGAVGREIAITKQGTGVLTLSGNNTYSGTTTISQGRISVSNANALGSTAAGTIVASGAQFFVSANNLTIPENFTVSGIGLGTTGANIGALGVQVNGANVTYSGTITLDNGATIGNYNAGTATMTINNGIAGTGSLQIRAGAANNGTARWRLLGKSSYSGSTQFSTVNVSGTMTVENNVDDALPTTTVLTLSGTNGSTVATTLNYKLFGFNQTLAGLSGGGSGGSGTTAFANIITGGSSALSTLTIDTAANHSFSGSLGGSGADEDNLAVVKSGVGRQVFSGSSSYAGGTRLNAGTLAVGDGTALGVGTITFAGGGLSSDSGTARALANSVAFSGDGTVGDPANTGVLTLSGPVDLGGATRTLTVMSTSTIAGTISNGSLTKSGAGTLVVSGSNAYTGGTTVSAGVLLLTATAAQPATGLVTVDNGATLAVAVGGAGQYSTSDFVALMSGSLTNVSMGASSVAGIDTSAGPQTIASTLDGTRGLVKLGTNTLTLTASNSYSGATSVTGGVLAVANGSALGAASGGVTVGSGATLALTGGVTVRDKSLSMAGDGASSSLGALLNESGTNEWSGPITVAAAASRITSSGGMLRLTGNLTNNNAGNFNIGGAGDIEITGDISGSMTLFKSSGGAGTLKLSGNNTYSGANVFANGVVSVANIGNVNSASSNLGAQTTVPDATLGLGSSSNSGVLRYTGTGETSDRVVNLRGTTGSATLDQSGSGLLRFTSNLTATGSGAKTLFLQGSTSGTGELSGIIPDSSGGATSLTKQGTGLWILSGANAYTGSTDVNVGGLLMNGAHVGAGLVTVASGARFGGDGSLAGGLTLASGGLFIFNPSTTLDVAGAVSLDNSFSVDSLVNLDGSEIDWSSIGDGTYTLISTTSTFTSITNFGVGNAKDIGGGRSAYFQNGSLQLVIVPEPSTLLLLGLGAGGSAALRRRARARCRKTEVLS